MPTNPRQVVADLQDLGQLQPQANPGAAANYYRPGEQQVYEPQKTNPMLKLANSLSQLNGETLQPMAAMAYQKYSKEEDAKAIADFQANRDKWSEAVRKGEIPVGANPHAARAVKRLMLGELADDFHTQSLMDFQTSSDPEAVAARESNNPQAMRQFIAGQQQKFYADNLKNGDKELYDPLDIQDAWVPKAEQTGTALMRAHANYRVAEVERELKDTVGATVSRAVDDTFANFGPHTTDAERKQAYAALSEKINDTMLNKDYGALHTGLDKKQGWDLVTDSIVARALASKDHGRDILESLDSLRRQDGPAFRDIPHVQQKKLQAEEHLTSLEIQQENHAWALQDRPYSVAAKERQVGEWAKQDERWEHEKQGWNQHNAAVADNEIFRSLSRRVYEGLRRPDSKQGVAIINDALRQAEISIPEHAERLRGIADTMTQRRLNVTDDPLVLATTRAKIATDPLSVKPDDLVKLVKTGQINAKTMMQLQDDLDRSVPHAGHPFMRQPEINEMLHQVSRGSLGNPDDEYSAEGQMRVAEATTAFRDEAQAWLEANPKGGAAAFKVYMRSKVEPIIEKANRDYGAGIEKGRSIQEQKGAMVLKKSLEVEQQKQAQKDQYQNTLKQHREQMDRQLAEDQRKKSLMQSLKPTGQKSSEGKPILTDEKGNVASEQPIVIHGVPEINNGGITIIPTIFGGKKYSDQEAMAIMRKNNGIDPDTGKKLRRWWSEGDAQIAAREREARAVKGYKEGQAPARLQGAVKK